MKVRLDQLVVEHGFAPSRDAAKRLILAGEIFVDGERHDKAGKSFKPNVTLEHRGRTIPYVGRGGLKLESALEAFGVLPQGDQIGLDIGASTGGFTDCLLQRGMGSVIAVDVGRGQIHQRLRTDPRVRLMEKTNARNLTLDDIGGERVATITIDVSFISLRLILPPCLAMLREGGDVIALVKPQFEAGRGQVGSGGIVRDPQVLEDVARDMDTFCSASGWAVLGWIVSPIRGAEGNIEFFMHLRASAPPAPGTAPGAASVEGAEQVRESASEGPPPNRPAKVGESAHTLERALSAAMALLAGDNVSDVNPTE